MKSIYLVFKHLQYLIYILILISISAFPVVSGSITPDDEIPQTQITKAPVEDIRQSEREADSKPNLKPYQPSGWADKIVVSTSTGTNTDDKITSADDIYIDWAVWNDSGVDISSEFYTAVYVDGVYLTHWVHVEGLQSGYYSYIEDYNIGRLSAGVHTIKIVADSNNIIDEISESDNEYTKNILVEGINLKAHNIVVSNSTGTSTDTNKLYPENDLFVDWSVLNDSNFDISSEFNTGLYIDEKFVYGWVSNINIKPNYYIYIEDYNIGSLAIGDHTIKIITDATGLIDELDETDNEYTKTITISDPLKEVNLKPYQPEGWSSSMVVSSSKGTNFNTAKLYTEDELYIDLAITKDSEVDISSKFYTVLYIDGVILASWVFNGMTTDYLIGEDYNIGKLSAGVHTIKFVIDPTGNIDERDETDNEYIRTITIFDSSKRVKIDTVYPSIGKIGDNLNITINGSGFNKDTRVSVSLDSGNKTSIIGSIKTHAGVSDVTVVDGKAYIANGNYGLQIVDVANPAIPVLVGSVNNMTSSTSMKNTSIVAVVDGNAYIAVDSGIEVVDITNPVRPVIIGSVNTKGYVEDITVVDGKAYVAEGTSGLEVIDISDPKNPIIMGFIDTPGSALSVAVVDNKAYIADRFSGLHVIDISNPSNLMIIGTVNTLRLACSVNVLDGNAYVADFDSGLQVIDIANPRNPTIIGFVDTPGYAVSVNVFDNKAYVADRMHGLQVIDITNPRKPVIINSVELSGSAESVTVSDGLAYVMMSDSVINIIDIMSLAQPNIIGKFDTQGYTSEVTVIDKKAYVVNGIDINYGYNGGFEVIDISNPALTLPIGSVNINEDGRSLDIVGNRAYVTMNAQYNGILHVIDISNPALPIILGSMKTPGNALGIRVIGDYAYVADGYDEGLKVIDISNPNKPVITGSLRMSGWARDVTVIDNIAYVAVSSGLQIVDITNPTKPNIIGYVDTTGSAQSVAVVDDKAYVAYGNGSIFGTTVSDGGLLVIDIVNPALPVIIGSVAMPCYVKSVTVIDDKAYVADGYSGLQVVDITNSNKPVIIGSVDAPGNANDVTIIDNKAYIAAGGRGLVIVPIPVEVTPTVINSNTLSVILPSPQLAGQYNIRIFNNDGESDELKGAVSFFEPAEYWNLAQKKSIIVAGRSASDNVLWNSTKTCTNMAYRALLTQGYTRNTIQYLSPENLDADHDGSLNDVDDDAALSTLEYAISNWAADTNELLLYMTDHGGDGTFRINPTEIATAQELDKWLDAFQNRTHARVILVYDACLSGSFINYLQPPGSEERIIITSTKPNESSYFNGPDGQISFSYQFWSSVMLNGNLNAAFTAGSSIVTGHTPQLDADSDGLANQRQDHSEALDITICRGRSVKREPPRITGISPDQTLSGGTSSAIWVDKLTFTNPLDRIFAIIEPPGVDALPADIPITDLPSVELSAIKDSNGKPTGKYEALYNDFTLKGTYKIAVYAVDKEEIYSNPARTNIIQNIGETSLLVLAAPKGGIYSKTQNVQFNFSPEDAEIYYTVDGSNPDPSITQDSNKYTQSNPITISEDTILKFIAIDSEGSKSPVYTETYTIDTIAPSSPDINLLENENSKIITNPYPTFYWKAPKDADYSILQYSKYSDFSEPEIISYLRGASGESSLLYTVSTPLPEYGKWYWRIQSVDKAGNKSLWSSSDLEFQEDTAVHKAVILSTGDIDENTSIDPNTDEGDSNEDFKTAMETIISHAYKALIWQNYDKSNIYLLLPDSAFDADKDGVSDVSARLTKDDFESAVKDWASDADDLIIFMVGHGENGIFHLSSSETLTAQEFKSWLDALQSASDVKVRIVYDASYSGSFIPYLASQQNKERITIASASVQNAGSGTKSSANFFNNGEISFSYPFWSNIRDTSKLYSSYFYGRSMMKPHRQDATYDADSDGTAYDNDDDDLNIISGIQIGYGRKAASSPPVIGSVCTSQVVKQNQISNQTFSIKDIWVSDISSLNPIAQVLAVISKGYDSQNGDSQTAGDIKTKAEIQLQDIDGDKKYEGSYGDQFTYNLFDSEGTYTIAIYAKDSQGYYSLPVTTTVTVVKDGDDSNYAVLTENSPAITVAEGVHVKVIGSAGANIVNVGSGANVECVNFPGENQIKLDEASSSFTVKRSGAVVILQNQASGTMVKIPATLTNQTVKFTNDNKSFTLVISNSGAGGAKVMLESLEVGLSEMQL
ncbi:MAG: C13 family peptidase [Desulfamplus sp.]